MGRTQAERKSETRARLVAAAAELFAEHGIDAVSVDAVADRADRTSGAVYAHFGSKQGLLLAVLDWWKESLLAVLFAEVAVTGSPTGQLAAVWDNMAAPPQPDTPSSPGSTSRRRSLLEHELVLRAARDPEVAEALRARHAAARRHTARELAWWTEAVGASPSLRPDELATLLKALFDGLELQERVDPGSVPTELVVRAMSVLLGLPLGGDAPAPEPTERGGAIRPTIS